MQWAPDYVDPYAYLNVLFDGDLIQRRYNNNSSFFDSRLFNRLLHSAARKRGSARYRAYRAVAAKLLRDAAPAAVFGVTNQATFVSKRVDCIVLKPVLDLAAACLKR